MGMKAQSANVTAHEAESRCFVGTEVDYDVVHVNTCSPRLRTRNIGTDFTEPVTIPNVRSKFVCPSSIIFDV